MSKNLPIRLPSIVRKDEETEAYVSYTPILDLYSAGMDEDEAIKAMQSAVDLFLKTASEKGTLMQVLQETGLISTGEEESNEIQNHKFYTGTHLHLGYDLACV